MSDSELNPYTGDLTGQRITSLGNAVYLRLMTPLGSWWADPSLGSRLHELRREKDLPRVGEKAREYAQTALKPLLDNGRAQSITVTTDQPHNGWLILEIEVIDAAGNPSVFRHPVRVL